MEGGGVGPGCGGPWVGWALGGGWVVEDTEVLTGERGGFFFRLSGLVTTRLVNFPGTQQERLQT